MKNSVILIFALGLASAGAESGPPSDNFEAKSAQRAQETPLTLNEQKPNEIKVGKLCYSGAAVEAFKIDNPFQLISPFAPSQYGWAEANIVRDPHDGKIDGLKIFSIEF